MLVSCIVPVELFVSREAATAERRYKKERWSENYVHQSSQDTRRERLSATHML
jgi:hypothetical protein